MSYKQEWYASEYEWRNLDVPQNTPLILLDFENPLNDILKGNKQILAHNSILKINN